MTFIREDRYVVIKLKDIDAILNDYERNNLGFILNKINYYRGFRGEVSAVVVEHDWPEYETVWKMIEDRMTNEG